MPYGSLHKLGKRGAEPGAVGVGDSGRKGAATVVVRLQLVGSDQHANCWK
jgi:hypothetical protein